MSSPTADDLFRDFCRAGDPKSLAGVFDLAAPELLRVARHLTVSGSEPEDLVQATFLTAIESRRKWDASRPVVPWLVGILVNHARMSRRRSRRTPDPSAIHKQAVSGPEQAACDRELAEQLERALSQLPDVYRPVVRLTLEHGLSPVEIARTLDRERGTVRSQLSRGLEMLRKALPAGIGVGVAATATPGWGLAAVRADVLERASTVANAAGAAGGSAVTVQKWVVSLLVLLVATWALQSSLSSGDGDVAIDQAAAITRSVESKSAAAPPSSLAIDGRTIQHSSTATTATRSKPRFGSLVVRILQKDSGEPLAGVPVVVQRSGALRHETLFPAAVGVTAGDGAARFDRVLQGSYELRALPSTAEADAWVSAGKTNEVDLNIAAGVRVEGDVVDANGTPVPGASIYLDTGLTRSWATLARADGQGRFVVRGVSSGFRIGARHAGFAPSPHHSVRGADGSTVRLRIVLGRPAARIHGRVVRDPGEPAAGAIIAILDEQKGEGRRDQDGLLWRDAEPIVLRADSNGEFESQQVPPGPITLIASRPGLPGRTATQLKLELLPGESRFVELRLARSAVVHGRVESEQHAPVRDKIVHLLPVRTRTAPGLSKYDVNAFVQSSARSDANGRYRLDGVMPGRYRLWTEGQVPGSRTEIEVFAGSSYRADLEVVARARLDLRVVDGVGRELAGWLVSVQLWRAEKPSGSWHEQLTSPCGTVSFPDMPIGTYKVLLAPKGTADTSHALDAFVVDDVRPSGKEERLRVPWDRLPSAVVRGTVVDDFARAVPSAELRLGSKSRPPADAVYHVDPLTGRVDASEIPPGRYSIRVLAPEHRTLDLGVRELAPDEVLELGPLRLRRAK